MNETPARLQAVNHLPCPASDPSDGSDLPVRDESLQYISLFPQKTASVTPKC